jgi:PAS domain S-box-containing protein
MELLRKTRGAALLIEPGSDSTAERLGALKDLGYDAIHAGAAEAAVRAAASAGVWDFALLDADMPGAGSVVVAAASRDFPVIFQAERDLETELFYGPDRPVYGFWRRDSGRTALAAAVSGAAALFRARRDLRVREAELRECETRLSSVMGAAPVGIGIIRDRIIFEVNDWVTRILGYSADELVGRSSRVLFMNEGDYDALGADFYAQLRERGVAEIETLYRKKTGEPVDVLLRGVPFDPAEPGRGTTFAMWDISSGKHMARVLDASLADLRSSETRLKTALEEKEAMFRELKHRVKNSFALMASLIGLESSNSRNAEVQEVLDHTRTRIESMASLYDLLGRQDNPNAIRLDLYLERIVTTISRSLVGPCDHVGFKLDLAPIQGHSRVAAPLGLVAMELVVNSLKHAFPERWVDSERREGRISATLSGSGDEAELEMADDGVGLPENVSASAGGGLGMDLCRMLVKQMNGSWRFLDGPGTRIRISVPTCLNEV